MICGMRRVRHPASGRWTARGWQLKSRVVSDHIQAVISLGNIIIVSQVTEDVKSVIFAPVVITKVQVVACSGGSLTM